MQSWDGAFRMEMEPVGGRMQMGEDLGCRCRMEDSGCRGGKIVDGDAGFRM